MKFQWTACLIICLLAAPALAGDVTLLHVRQGAQLYQGTAFKIGSRDGRDYYLTAGHNLRSATSGRIARGGRWQDVDLVAWSLQPDLGVVSLPADGSPAFQLASKPPATGAELSFGGYAGGQPRTSRGSVIRVDPSNGQLLASIPVHPGDSGGPLHVRNEICYGLVIEWLPDSTCGPSGCRRRNIGCRAVDSVTIAHWIRDRCPQAYYDCERPTPDPRPLPDSRSATPRPSGATGPRGDVGPTGPAGPPGRDADPAVAAARAIEILRRDYPHLFEPHSTGRGDPGPAGPPGPAGTVTVIVRDNGQEIHRAERVPAGKTIVVPIERTERTH